MNDVDCINNLKTQWNEWYWFWLFIFVIKQWKSTMDPCELDFCFRCDVHNTTSFHWIICYHFVWLILCWLDFEFFLSIYYEIEFWKIYSFKIQLMKVNFSFLSFAFHHQIISSYDAAESDLQMIILLLGLPVIIND